MKLIVVLLVVVAMGAKVQSEMASKEVMERCAKEHGITMETLNKEQNSDNPDKQVKCAVTCVYEEFLNVDGTPNMEKLTEKLSGNKETLEIVKECAASAPKGGDKCETAFAIARCTGKKMAKMQSQ